MGVMADRPFKTDRTAGCAPAVRSRLFDRSVGALRPAIVRAVRMPRRTQGDLVEECRCGRHPEQATERVGGGMVRAGRIAGQAETADGGTAAAIKAEPATEGDRPANALAEHRIVGGTVFVIGP